MPVDPETLGYAAATLAAALWAVGTVLYGVAGRTISPVRLNAIKGVGVTLLFAAVLQLTAPEAWRELADHAGGTLVLLGISGVIGITLGDSFYFAAVNRVGPRRSALLSLLATPMAIVGGAVFLGETLRPQGAVGIALTLAGVAWVVAERGKQTEATRAGVAATGDARGYAVGLLFGLLAATGQAVGAVINRHALVGTELSPLATAFWRLGVATVCLIPLAIVVGGGGRRGRPTARVWLVVAVAALLGTFGGIWLQQVAFDSARAGPTQTLLSTTPVWILPVAALAGERVTWRAVLGAVVAVAGVAILVMA